MSVQSDTELLSIQSLEVYATKNGMSLQKAREIFHQNQVFEKIILQHEYLHQVSFDEVMEFVENVITENNQKLILFHGTTDCFDEISLPKSHNRRDFGKGFYTTILESQAKEWAYRLSLRRGSRQYFVNKYLFEENEALKILRFDSLDESWLEFIKENRSKGGLPHDYDVVIGPVADDNTMETVQLYIAGILSAREAVDRLRYNDVNNQVSFHTDKSLRFLKPIGRTEYE